MSDWQTLADLAEPKGLIGGPFGSNLVNRDYQDIGVPVIRGANMGERFLRGEFVYVSQDKYEEDLARNVAQPGDLIFTQRGTLGQVSLVPRGAWNEFVISQSQMRLRVDEAKANPDWVYYYCTTDDFIRQIDNNAISVGVPHINLGILSKLQVPRLLRRRQAAIAEVLGALDEKIAANETLASKLMEMGEFKYLQGTEGADSCWMSDVLEPILGGTPSRSDDNLWDGSIPWVSAKDISRAQAGFVIATDEGISEEAAVPKRLRPLEPGSVVLTARGTVGAVARLSIAASINQSCYGFVTGRVPAGCLYFLIKGSVAQAQAMAHGSVFDTITKKTFENVSVPDMTREEWLNLESRVGPVVSASESAVIESRQLARTRDELLPLLMSGKITVEDAEKVVSDAV